MSTLVNGKPSTISFTVKCDCTGIFLRQTLPLSVHSLDPVVCRVLVVCGSWRGRVRRGLESRVTQFGKVTYLKTRCVGRISTCMVISRTTTNDPETSRGTSDVSGPGTLFPSDVHNSPRSTGPCQDLVHTSYQDRVALSRPGSSRVIRRLTSLLPLVGENVHKSEGVWKEVNLVTLRPNPSH